MKFKVGDSLTIKDKKAKVVYQVVEIGINNKTLGQEYILIVTDGSRAAFPIDMIDGACILYTESNDVLKGML